MTLSYSTWHWEFQSQYPFSVVSLFHLLSLCTLFSISCLWERKGNWLRTKERIVHLHWGGMGE